MEGACKSTEAVRKILAAQESLLTDPQYRQLNAEYTVLNEQFIQLLETLPGAQKAMIEDYIGIFAQMHIKMLEAVCLQP